MKMTLWQVEALARWMRQHDDPADDTLNTAHVDLTEVTDGFEERIVAARTEAGAYIALWHDGSDVTDEYPEH